MKTVFIAVFQGTEFRNIIRTDIYKELINQPNVRLVLFTDNEVKRDYFQSQFNAPNVIYEIANDYRPHWSAPIFGFLKYNLIKTGTLDMKRRRKLEQNGNYFNYYFRWLTNRLLANRLSRIITRWAAFHLVRDDFFASYYDKYQPQMVLLAHLFSDIETSMLREAKRRKIISVGLINSWDKLTSRNMLLLLPDKMLVHNRIVKNEAIRLADMSKKDITIVGIPHFDHHFKTPRSSKKEFAKRFGLDPNKRYVVFCPEGKTYIDSDGQMASLIDEMIASGELPNDLQLIIRLPPNDIIDIYPYKTKVVIQQAGKRFSKKRGVDWDMDEEDFRLLADTMRHASVIILYASTVAMDAAVFNKPLISVNIKFPNYPSTDWVYEYEHCGTLLRTGGLDYVRTRADLANSIKRYLENPQFNDDGRSRIREEQCHYLDGRSGKRVAEYILDLLNV
ncbi:MAG: CDP-glycerol glycerophosphotransferase family protein [Candidatus Harrisonbacteria bacterium]|nr:CDP-glycerol glycerophosphotransferase family protein [Candidatus Harrisonbacteria bacterium]